MSSVVPEGWGNLPVAEVFEVGRGRVISKDEIRDNAGRYPVFSSQSKNNGEMGRLDSYDFEGEYVTWTTDGAYAGTVFYRSGRFNCTNVCGTLRDKGIHAVDMRFASEYLSTVARNHVSYVGNPKLMNGVFGEIDLLLPPLPEQKKIASILTSVDEVIENTQKQIDKLQDLKKATMNDLLTKGIGHKEFKDSELGRIPKSWEVKKIKDLGSFFGGLTGKTAKDFGDGHPFLTYMQVFLQKTSDKERVNFVSINASEKQNRVAYGDVLFTTSSETPNEIGMTTVFLETDWSPYLNSFCFGLRVEAPSPIDPLFAKYVLRGDKFREDMRPLAQGSTRFNLSKGNLAKLNLLLPSLPEQKKIASILTSVDEVIENTQKQIYKLQDLKKSLMQDLLTGKVRVTVN